MSALTGQVAATKPPAGRLPAPSYRTYEALSELVDNSVGARDKDGVCIQISLDYTAKSIQVYDDGVGMGLDELRRAMAANGEAARPQQKRPGVFGLGMKAACLFLGSSFTVSTSEAGSAQEHVVEYDDLRQGGAASRGPDPPPCATRKKADPSEHGTRVLLTNLRVPLYAEQTTLFKKRLGERYCDYIREGQVKVRINSVECQPISTETVIGSVKNFELEIRPNKVVGWIGTMKGKSPVGSHGMSLYRRNRLITMRSPFGLRDDPGAARVVGRMSLDHVPVNARETGFVEDSPEYLEAESAFRAHPAVRETVKNSKHGVGISSVDADHLYDYLLGRRDNPPAIGQRIGRLDSRSLLDMMPRLEADVEGRAVTIEYADAGGPPYEKHEEGNGMRYVINKDSPVFGAVQSPFCIVALVVADMRASLGRTAGRSQPAPDAHLATWASMVDGLARGGKRRRSAAKRSPSNGYSLSRNLVELHSLLEECYYNKFEFTGLSTLAPYTHNALASPVYSLYTEKEQGEYLCDFIMDFGTGYVPLINPNGRDIDMWRYASGDKHLVAVREYSAGELSGPIAPPAKAWMDLVREVHLYHLPYMEEDLISILDRLKGYQMLALRDLDAIARRRKSGHASHLIEQVFAE